MLGEFWKGVSSKVAEHAVARLLTPACLFWLAGVVAWFLGDRWSEIGDDGLVKAVDRAVKPITEASTGAQIALAIGAVGLVTVTATLVERMTWRVLRFLEGYWPRSAGDTLRDRVWKKREARIGEWAALLEKRQGAARLTSREREKLARLELRIRDVPGERSVVMPTRIGNILRGAETRPKATFGLDPILCWPFLWPLLEDADRTELAEARGQLDTSVRSCLFAGLLIVWTPFWIAAAPAGVGLAVAIYYVGCVGAARNFAVLMESIFFVRRFALYDALRLVPPTGTGDEPASGERVTSYLWYGQAPPAGFPFAHPRA